MTRAKQKIKRPVPSRTSEALPIRSSWIADQGWCVWLEQDPTSVPAMLRGRGDGREKLYERFAQYWRKRNPALSEETLHASYAEYALHMDRHVATERQAMPKQAVTTNPAHRSTFFIGRLSQRSPPTADILLRIDKRWMCLLLVAVVAYGAAQYV